MKKSNAGHEINRVNFGYKYTKRIFSMSIWMLFIFSFFIPQKNIYAASENILTKPERWLNNLSQEDQRMALLSYQIRLGEKSADVLAKAKDAKDRLWSAKILFCGYNLAARFAKKNKDQQEALALMADALGDAISSKGTIENRKSRLEEADSANQKVAESVLRSAFDSFRKEHAVDSDDMNKTLTVAAMLCASADIIEKEQSACSPKGTDVCKMARKMAHEMAPLLPIRLNSNLVVQTVVAVKGSISITAILEYSKSHLERLLSSSGMNNNEMLKIMNKHAKDGFCQPNTPNKSFIDLGGVVEYRYRFNDGSIYTQQRIDSCLSNP